MVTGLTTLVRFPVGSASRPAVLPMQPAVDWLPRALFSGNKLLGLSWNCTVTPSCVLMARCLIEHGDDFCIYFHVSLICCSDILLILFFNKQAEHVVSRNMARHIDKSHTSSVDVTCINAVNEVWGLI
jgi:hypothetical protein